MYAKAWRPQATTQMCNKQEGEAEKMIEEPEKRSRDGTPPAKDAQDEGGSRRKQKHVP